MSSLYCPIGENDTRLLTIKSYDEKTAILELEVYSPQDIPEYDAVTYAWGDETEETKVTCNGHQLLIRSSLLSGMKHIYTYRPAPSRPLWIDAICLNQEDDAEKATQVPRMGNIYQSASRTLIWLGEGDDESSLAMDWMVPLTAKLVSLHAEGAVDKIKQAYAQGSGFEEHGLPDPKGSVWIALANLYDRPWFHRLWTLQEAVLSEKLLLICGDKWHPWASISAYPKAATEANLAILLDPGPRQVDSQRRQLFHEQIDSLRKLLSRSPNAMALHALLEFSVGRHCKEPVDRIWALLGLLARPTRQLIAEEHLINYTPKRRKNYHESYQEVMRLLVRKQPFFALPLLALGCVQAKTCSMPSWHADWHGRRLYNPIAYFRNHRSGYPNHCARHPYPIMKMIDPLSLQVLGLKIDEVEKVTPGIGQFWHRSFKDGVTQLLNEITPCCDWIAECFNIAQTISLAAAESLRFHSTNPINPATPETANSTLLTIWQRYQDFLNVLYGMLFPNEAVPHLDSGLLTAFCTGRKFFTTAGGRIGMGPSDMRKGDLVCAFYGGCPLFILRPQPVTGTASTCAKKEFELVGDAYVPGLMYGEAFARRSCETLEHFTLV